MKITAEEAIAIANDRLAIMLDEYTAHVQLVEVEGGWYARLELPPEHDDVLGLGRLYVADDGRTFFYPSSHSPRMADAAFQSDRAPG